MMSWWVAVALAAPVEGRVFERGTGAPLPGAQIVLADGTTLAADEQGRFTLELAEGSHRFDVTEPAHDGAVVEVEVPLARTVQVFLEPIPVSSTIVVESFRPTAHVSRQHVDAEMAYETPGTYDDAVRLVAALPGVSVQREFSPSSGELAIRGSVNGDNRYFLDGVEVPYLYHYNQYSSVFPASQLDDLDMYPSGFGVKYGDSTGAVIEAESTAERPKDVTGQVGLNFIMGNAGVSVPLPKGWWVSASGRRSYQDLVTPSTQQYAVWPVFGDFAFRAEKEHAEGSTGVFVWGAGDRYARVAGELDLLDPVEAEQSARFDYRRDFQVAGVRHLWRTGRVVAAVVHDNLRGTLAGGGEEHRRTVTLSSRLDARGAFSERLKWEAGYELRAGVVDLATRAAGPDGVLVAEEAPTLGWNRDLDRTLWRAQAGAYGELHLLTDTARIIPGLRVGLDTTGVRPLVEPRLSGRWQVARQTMVKGIFGRYQQVPDPWLLAALPDLPTTDSWQIGLGIEQTVEGRLEVGLDGYGKFIDNPLFFRIDATPEVEDAGRSFGLELTTRYRLLERFFLWGWVGMGHAQVLRDGAWIATQSDQPFSAGGVASWDITEPLNVAVRYRIASGLPYTPIDGSTYDATHDSWVPIIDRPNAARMPLYQKIDLHAAYTFTFRRWSLEASADVWIVPGPSAQLYPTWSYDYRSQGFVIGPTVLPLLGIRARF